MSGRFTLYGMRSSTATARVTLALEEANFTEYDFVDVNLAIAENKKPAYLAINPYGKVPTLVTSAGVAIIESRAIIKYLARTYPSHFSALAPDFSDPVATALFEADENAESLYFSEPMGKIMLERFFKPMFGQKGDEEVVTRELKTLTMYLDILDERFKRTKAEHAETYVHGDAFGIADIYHIPYLAKMEQCDLGDELVARPQVHEWWGRVQARDVVQKFINGLPRAEDYKKMKTAGS